LNIFLIRNNLSASLFIFVFMIICEIGWSINI